MFELLTDMTTLLMRSFPVTLATEPFLSPMAANRLFVGEWMELSGGEPRKLLRATGATPSWVLYTPSGSTDSQTLKQVTIIKGGSYEADTKVFTAGAIVVGSQLKVDDVTIGVATKSGLVLHAGAADTDFVVAYADVLAVDNNGYLRFTRTDPSRLA